MTDDDAGVGRGAGVCCCSVLFLCVVVPPRTGEILVSF